MFKAIKHGIVEMWKHRGLVLVYYGINLLFGLACLFPIWLLLDQATLHSLITELPGGFRNAHFLLELFGTQGSGPIIAAALSLFLFMSYLFLHLFLGMGTLQVYCGGKGSLARVFWGGVGAWFWPLVRLALCSLPFLALLSAMLLGTARLFDSFAADTPFQTKAAVLIGLGTIGLFLYARLMDYARIYAMSRQDRRMLRACLHGAIFVLRHLFPVCLLAIFYGGLAAATGIGFLKLEKMLTPFQHTFLLSLGLGQVHMLLRLALKLSLCGAQLNYYNGLHDTQAREQDEKKQPPIRRRPVIWESNLELENDLKPTKPEYEDSENVQNMGPKALD